MRVCQPVHRSLTGLSWQPLDLLPAHLGVVDVEDLDALSATGHGLSNIRERLRLELGAGATMRLERGAVCVRLPLERSEPTNKLLTDDPLHHRR